MPAYKEINIDRNEKPSILKAGKMYIKGDEDMEQIPEGVIGGTSISHLTQNKMQNNMQNNEEQVQPKDVNRTKENVHRLLSNIEEKQLYEESNEMEEIPEEPKQQYIEKFDVDKYFNITKILKPALIIAGIYWLLTIPAIQSFINNSIFGIVINPNNKIILVLLYGLLIGLIASLIIVN